MKRLITLLASLCVCAGCVNRTDSLGTSASVSAILYIPEMSVAEGAVGTDASRTYTGDMLGTEAKSGIEAKSESYGKTPRTNDMAISEAVFYIFDERGGFVSKSSFTNPKDLTGGSVGSITAGGSGNSGTSGSNTVTVATSTGYDLHFPQSGDYLLYVLCNISALADLPEAPTKDELESLTLPHCGSYAYLPFAGRTRVTVTGDTPTVKITLSRINSAIRIENRTAGRAELSEVTVSGLPSRGNVFDTATEAAGVTYTESAEAAIDADGNAVVYSFLVPERQIPGVRVEAKATVKDGDEETVAAASPLAFIERLEAGIQATALIGYADDALKIDGPDNWGNTGTYELPGGVKLSVVGGEFFDYNNVKALRAYSGGSVFAFTVTSTEGAASLKVADGAADWVTIGDGTITVAPNDGTSERECRVAVVVGGNNAGMFRIVQGRPIVFTGSDDAVVEDGRVVVVGGRSTTASVVFEISSEELNGMEIVPVGNGERGVIVVVDRKTRTVTASFMAKVDASEVGDDGVGVPVEFRDMRGAVHATLTFVQRPAAITFDPERYAYLSSQGGTVTASVTVEGDARWSVRSLTDKNGASVGSWITKLSPSVSGASGGNFELEVKPNTGNGSRTAYLRIESRNTVSKPYAITQMPSYGIKSIRSETGWDAATNTLKAYSKGRGYEFTFETGKAVPEGAELAVDCLGANGFFASDITNVSENIYAFTLTVPDSDDPDHEAAHEIAITLSGGEMGRFSVLQAYKPTFVSVNEEVYGGVKSRPELKKATYRASGWDAAKFASSNAALAVTKVSDTEISIAYAETLAYDTEAREATVTMNLEGGNSVTYNTIQKPVAFVISDDDLAKITGVSKDTCDVSVTVKTEAGKVSASWRVGSVSDDWFTTTPAEGGTETNASGAELTFHFETNAGEERSGNITLESLNTTSQKFSVKQNTGLYDPLGTVTIGGIQWTKYNLANPRQASGGATFATKLPSQCTGVREESHGKFYQWNVNVAWNSTGSVVDTSTPPDKTWQSSITATTWSTSPCPDGFVVPTKAQWDALISACTKEYKGGFSASDYGYIILTSGDVSLEFPAVGHRYYQNTSLGLNGIYGICWASMQMQGNASYAYRMTFNSNTMATDSNRKTFGFNVRCVHQ